MHSDFLPTADTPPAWREEFVLTREEIAHGLYMTDPRKASKLRIGIEGAVLCAAALYFLIGWLTAEQKSANGIVLTLCCVFVLVMLLFGPRLQAQSTARRSAKEQQPIVLRGYDGALGFGEGDKFSVAAYDEFTVAQDETMFVFQFAASGLVIVPRRAVSETTWNWLCTALVANAAKGE